MEEFEDEKWIPLCDGLMKKILIKGRRGQRPHFWDEIEATHRVQVPDSEEQLVKLRVGAADNAVRRFVEIACSLMDVDETSLIRCPDNSIHQIHLIGIKSDGPVRTWSVDRVLDASQRLREEAATLYRQNRSDDAFHLYASALKVLIPVEVRLLATTAAAAAAAATAGAAGAVEQQTTDAPPEVARVSRFAASLYGNVAACHLLSGRFDDARAVCDESLARDATDVRVVYRKARALMGLADYEQCRRVCHLGLALEPGNAALRRLHEAARVHGLSQQQPLVRGLRRFFGAS